MLSRIRVRQKARTTSYLWFGYAAAYALFALAGSLAPAIVAGALTGAIQSALMILLYSAAQEEVPDAVLGRVVGLISLVHRGAHATGLIFIGPIFAVLAARSVFFGAAVTLPLVGFAALATIRLRRFPIAAAGAPARAPD
jgi:hypothetical protein